MEEGGIVSVPTDTLDQMVAAASVPNLASLFRQGKEAGLITPITGYGEGSGTKIDGPPPF